MSNKPTINIYPETTSKNDMHRWPFCYLHGNAEFEYDEAESGPAADLFVADAPMPEAVGNYLVFIGGEPAVAVLATRYNIVCGRVALISDTEALAHALDVEAWT